MKETTFGQIVRDARVGQRLGRQAFLDSHPELYTQFDDRQWALNELENNRLDPRTLPDAVALFSQSLNIDPYILQAAADNHDQRQLMVAYHMYRARNDRG